MRGVVKGEQSSVSNPLLQLFVRSGGFLTDFYAGTYRIDDIRKPAEEASVVVAQAAFTANEKLGTGRYVIPTGTTTTWPTGTYRALCSFQLVQGGPTFYQAVEFEILDSGDWVTGAEFVSYASTRRLIADGYIDTTANLQSVHRTINRISRRIEAWTSRWFDPRYLSIDLDGVPGPHLFLQEAVIAVEKVEAVWKQADGTVDTYEYSNADFDVYNRHLDGMTAPDDRSNPKIVRSDGWPTGVQGIRLSGVFGYTDPAADPQGLKVNLGRTPEDLVQVIGALFTRDAEDPTLANPLTQQPGSVKSMRTRDQSITFFGSGGSTSGGGGGGGGRATTPTGDPFVDNLLARFAPPMQIGYVGKRESVPGYSEEFER